MATVVTDNDRLFIKNMASGKTAAGGQATPGQIAWANAELKKIPAATTSQQPPATQKATQSTPNPTTAQQIKPPTSNAPAVTKPSNAIPQPTTQASNMYSPPTDQWSAKQNELFTRLEGLMNTPFAYNPETDPAYQAQRQLAQLRAGDASRSAMEAMNEKGLLGSSMTTSQLGQIQQRAEQEAAAYIPQYREQAYGQYQDQLRGVSDLLSTARNLRGDEFDRSVTEADLTGNYLNPQANEIIGRILQAKQDFAAATDDAGRSSARQRADSDRALLASLGIDPNLFGSDVTLQQAAANQNKAGVRTLGGQEYDRNILEADRDYNRGVFESDREYDYKAALDKIADERDKREFDEKVRQNGLDHAIQWYNANTSRMQQDRLANEGGTDNTKVPSVTTVMNNVNKLFGTYDNASRRYVVTNPEAIAYIASQFPDDPQYDDIIDQILASYNLLPQGKQNLDRPISGMLPSQ